MTIHITVDTRGERTPFPHFWELCVGSCHAVMGLRADWRSQLKKAHAELGFRYVRFHGLLDDAMSVYVKDQWSEAKRFFLFNIDAIFDFLLSIGMKPFIELGFMPTALASGTQTCFHYQANVTPPADYAEWGRLVQTLTQHLVDRYGIDEVREWFFEVWNEPNLPFFWAGTQEEYFKLYEYAARAIKSVDSRLRVGGPATSVNAWIPDMIAFCQRSGAPLDFISTHHYPTDDPLWRNNDLPWEEFLKVAGQYERGVLYQMTAKARAEAGDLPLYYTEWNTSAMVPDAGARRVLFSRHAGENHRRCRRAGGGVFFLDFLGFIRGRRAAGGAFPRRVWLADDPWHSQAELPPVRAAAPNGRSAPGSRNRA